MWAEEASVDGHMQRVSVATYVFAFSLKNQLKY